MARAEPPLHEQEGDHRSGYVVAVVAGLLLVFAIVAMPFVPLLLAFCEHTLLGTRHVEETCEWLGIHDELGTLYQTIFAWFR